MFILQERACSAKFIVRAMDGAASFWAQVVWILYEITSKVVQVAE
jgi:hypothetical protein